MFIKLVFLQSSGVTWQIGSVDGTRGQFVNNTSLNNTVDPNFHPVEPSVPDLPFTLISAD